jgi:hypothetical protein
MGRTDHASGLSRLAFPYLGLKPSAYWVPAR